MSAVKGFCGVVFVGSGPAGLAPLFAAASAGTLQQLLSLGVVILERNHEVGGGELTRHAIRSDSSAEAFLDIVLKTKEPRLQALSAHPITQRLSAEGKKAAPLALVAAFLSLAGRTLCDMVAASARGRVLLGTEATTVRRSASGGWITSFRDVSSGIQHDLHSSAVVLALGAHQPEHRLMTERVAGVSLLPVFRAKLIQSGEVLSHGGLEKAAEMLPARRPARVAIVGGSTSAGAVALRLLGTESPLSIEEGGLTLMHRKPLRIFYDSAADARAEGYEEFASTDVCPLTGRVFRLSGFRLDSRELIMAGRGLGGRAPEPRLRLFRLRPESEDEARRLLEGADLIVSAMGYSPRMLPVLDVSGELLPIRVPGADRWSIVDRNCRLMTSPGLPLPQLYAIGLSVGPAHSAELGGESDFRGQVNSLWLWQHTLGKRIVDSILEAADQQPRGSKRPLSLIPSAVPTRSSQGSALAVRPMRWA